MLDAACKPDIIVIVAAKNPSPKSNKPLNGSSYCNLTSLFILSPKTGIHLWIITRFKWGKCLLLWYRFLEHNFILWQHIIEI